MEQLIVGIADMKSAMGEVELVTYALGSCVGICIYDEVMKVGGMLHAMLPGNGGMREEGSMLRYVESGLPVLLSHLSRRGADRRRMKAKIVGGATMFQFESSMPGTDIGQANVTLTKNILQRMGIPVIAEVTGGTVGRSVWFVPATGEVTVKTTDNQTIVI